MSLKELVETKVAAKLAAHGEAVARIGKRVALELGGEEGGRWIIDCAASPATIAPDSSTAVVATIRMDGDVFARLMDGSLNPQAAFLTGKVKVDGDLGTAIKLGQLMA